MFAPGFVRRNAVNFWHLSLFYVPRIRPLYPPRIVFFAQVRNALLEYAPCCTAVGLFLQTSLILWERAQSLIKKACVQQVDRQLRDTDQSRLRVSFVKPANV